jgi:putative transcriptional regulator
MNSLKGHLLIAAPSLVAPFFSRTVILLFEHSDAGAMGVILNRPTEATVGDVAEQVLKESLDWDKPIHVGGPVPGPLLIVHGEADLADQEVLDGVYSSIEAEKVQQLIRRQTEPCLVVANYSGWGPGQLESEMEEDSWLTWPATGDLIFWDSGGDLWNIVVGKVRAAQLQDMLNLDELPEDPSLN